MERETGKIPVIVGITGHKDLRERDSDELKNAVCTQLESLRKKYPHSGLAVMTCLAEGADQLCAETALGMGFRVMQENTVRNQSSGLSSGTWLTEELVSSCAVQSALLFRL